MVGNTSIELINYALQQQSEQNIKYLIIFTVLIIAIIALYVDRKHVSKSNRPSFVLLKLGLRMYYSVVFFFTILFYYLISFSEDLGETITAFVLYGYIILTVFAILFISIYALEELFKMVGWEITMDGLKITKTHTKEK